MFLLLFVYLYGGTLGAGLPGVSGGGDRGDYLVFITPGILIMAVASVALGTAIEEPEHDTSGYRRYDAKAVVDLIRIRTLAGAGVPLARVEELLPPDEEQFAEAVTEIDKRLRAEIRERQRYREEISRLAAGDTLALPPESVAYLDRLREVGVPDRMVEGEGTPLSSSRRTRRSRWPSG